MLVGNGSCFIRDKLEIVKILLGFWVKLLLQRVSAYIFLRNILRKEFTSWFDLSINKSFVHSKYIIIRALNHKKSNIYYEQCCRNLATLIRNKVIKLNRSLCSSFQDIDPLNFFEPLLKFMVREINIFFNPNLTWNTATSAFQSRKEK